MTRKMKEKYEKIGLTMNNRIHVHMRNRSRPGYWKFRRLTPVTVITTCKLEQRSMFRNDKEIKKIVVHARRAAN